MQRVSYSSVESRSYANRRIPPATAAKALEAGLDVQKRSVTTIATDTHLPRAKRANRGESRQEQRAPEKVPVHHAEAEVPQHLPAEAALL